MIATTALRKSISYVTDTSGDKLAIQFNLKNRIVREIMEDFLDTLDIIDREKEPSRPFDEVHQEILAKHRKNASVHN
jgi:BMFP domain-containing protein YqiC